MSRHTPVVRTLPLFTGVVHCVSYHDKTRLVTVQVCDDKLAYSKIDENCNVLSGSIDSAFHSLQEIPLVTLVTPLEIITNIPLVDKKIVSAKPLFTREHKRLHFAFSGTRNDAHKLRRGTPFVMYAVNLAIPCGSREE